MRPADELEREDLLQFLNAAFVSTGQGEFYSTAGEQRVSLAFLKTTSIFRNRAKNARMPRFPPMSVMRMKSKTASTTSVFIRSPSSYE